MIYQKKINRKTYYFQIKGNEHNPPHVHITTNKRSWSPEIIVKLQDLKILQNSFKSNETKIILSFLEKSPKFVEELITHFHLQNKNLK